MLHFERKTKSTFEGLSLLLYTKNLCTVVSLTLFSYEDRMKTGGRHGNLCLSLPKPVFLDDYDVRGTVVVADNGCSYTVEFYIRGPIPISGILGR